MGKFEIIDKNLIYISIFLIIIGESLIFFGKVIPGLVIHLINLLIIVLLIIFFIYKDETRDILQGLILVILLRVVNLSTPQFFTNTLMQYPLIYGLMFIPLYLTIKDQYVELINFKKIYIYLPIGIMIGIIMAFFEYRFIGPTHLIDTFKISNIILLTIIMVAFIGTVEEIIFRPILLTRSKKIFGIRYGLILSGFLFGVMHSTYGIYNEILFATIFGIFLGYIYYKCKNIIFNILLHGATNIMLFGIYPFKMSIISNSIYSSDIIRTAGAFMAIFLIILLSISFLVADTMHNNRYVLNTMNICYFPLSMSFILIVIFNAILVI